MTSRPYGPNSTPVIRNPTTAGIRSRLESGGTTTIRPIPTANFASSGSEAACSRDQCNQFDMIDLAMHGLLPNARAFGQSHLVDQLLALCGRRQSS